MKRTTGVGAGKGGPRDGPRPASARSRIPTEDISVALAAIRVLRADLQQALARVETAIAEMEGRPVGATTPAHAPDGPDGSTARPKRAAPLREKGERGRRAPVLPGRRTPPRENRASPDTPGEET